MNERGPHTMGVGSTSQPVGSPPQEETRQLRGSSLLLAGRVIALGINFVVQVLIIRHLAKSDYGAFAYALSILALTQSAIQLGLDRGLTRYVPIYDERGETERLFGAIGFVVGLVTGLGTIVVVSVIAFQSVIAGTLVQDEGAVTVLVIMIALAPIEALDNLLIGLLAAFEETAAIFLRRYVVAPLLRLSVVGLLVFRGGSVEFLAAGYVAAGAIGLTIFGSHLIRLLRRRRSASSGRPTVYPIRELLTFSIPLLTTDLVFMALNASDVIMLDRFGSPEDVASLRAVLPTAKLNQVVLASFGILYVPFVARLYARGDHRGIARRYWQTASWVVFLTFPILATTLLFADELTGDLLGRAYADSAVILVILSLGYTTNAFFGFNGMTLNVFRAIGFIVTVNVLAVAANIGLNLAFIPAWGPVGAAAATAATYVLHNLLRQYGLIRKAGVRGFNRAIGWLYASAAAGAAVAIIAGPVLGLHFAVRVALVPVLAIAVAMRARHVLSIEDAFPIVAKLPLVKRLTGSV